MNTYFLFAFADCYPAGGMGDCVAVLLADTDHEAAERARAVMVGRHDDHIELVRIEGTGWREVALDSPGLKR